MKNLVSLFTLLLCGTLSSQTDALNGDWKKHNVFLSNTAECDYMIRQGDIDNLGFGWEEKFNPFSGKSTPAHAYPWERDTTEILGYDMIQVPSSSNGNAPCGGDGYSWEKANLDGRYNRSTFDYEISTNNIDTSKIKSASFQLFVDDFQAPVFCSKFEAKINGVLFPELTKTLNSINQTGPIGKLITVKAGPEMLKELKKSSVKISIDDTKTGAADGFAIDFIKILINPKKLVIGNVSGKVLSPLGKPLANAEVECGGVKTKTDAKGMFKFTGLTAGLNVLSINAKGFKEKTFSVDVEENQTTMQDCVLDAN